MTLHNCNIKGIVFQKKNVALKRKVEAVINKHLHQHLKLEKMDR